MSAALAAAPDQDGEAGAELGGQALDLEDTAGRFVAEEVSEQDAKYMIGRCS